MARIPNFQIEAKLGSADIIGIDEVGRGCLAGPVVAAAVILPCTADGAWLGPEIDGIADSKKMTANKREELYAILVERCRYVIGMASVEEVDQYNILEATMMAMRRAVGGFANGLGCWRIIDGNRSPWPCDERAVTVIGGDSKSLTIAAASIIAKVTRDRLMRSYAVDHPQYMWEENKGYGTAKHIKALRQFGPSHLHRITFIKNYTV